MHKLCDHVITMLVPANTGAYSLLNKAGGDQSFEISPGISSVEQTGAS